MENNVNTFIDEIESVSPDQTTIVFKNSKLDKHFLLMAIRGSKNRIMIFDDSENLNKIGEIMYSRGGKSIYISSLEVNENFQQNGFGRLLFELAAAHSDAIGATKIYGDASPINNIKGVSDNENATFEDEEKAIIEIYKKLGCKINPYSNQFYHTWQSGEKIKKANPLIQKIIAKFSERDGFDIQQNQPQ